MNTLLIAAAPAGETSPLILLFIGLSGLMAGFVTYKIMRNYALNVWKLRDESDDYWHATGWATAALVILFGVLSGVAFAKVGLLLAILATVLSGPGAAAVILFVHGCVIALRTMIDLVVKVTSGK